MAHAAAPVHSREVVVSAEPHGSLRPPAASVWERPGEAGGTDIRGMGGVEER